MNLHHFCFLLRADNHPIILYVYFGNRFSDLFLFNVINNFREVELILFQNQK